jgi:hypothetical protein
MPRLRDGGEPPTAQELTSWPTSRLLSAFVQVTVDPFASGAEARGLRGTLRRLYAAEIDRRFPVPGRGK